MNENKFMEVLTSMGLKWTARPSGVVRSSLEVSMGMGVKRFKAVCPITAVCFEKTGIYYVVCGWEAAAKAMGMNLTFAEKVQEAADGTYRSSRQVRETLLEAVGLEGEPV